MGLAGLPRVAEEWRRFGRDFEGVVYFVYDMRSPIGAEIGAHIHGRRRGIAYEAALVELRQLVAATSATDDLPAGAQICEPEYVLKLVRHLDPEVCDRLRREFERAPPASQLRMVMLEEHGIRLELVAIPLSN